MASAHKQRVAIIGGGVIGLTTGVVLSESKRFESVSIFTKDLSPNTTSDLSGGIVWFPALKSDEEIVS
jgi:glycine/D-amino acid oxidase-like deaminating enzyme